MDKKMFEKNKEYLEDNDIQFNGRAWDEFPFSAELECWTDAGEDMIIDLEELSKNGLQKWIDGFDVNEEVMLWWTEMTQSEREQRGYPFDNIKDHYTDLENFLEWLQGVCDGMEF